MDGSMGEGGHRSTVSDNCGLCQPLRRAERRSPSRNRSARRASPVRLVGRAQSVELERRIDAVEIRCAVAERQELLTAAASAARRRPGEQAEVLENPARDPLVVDKGDQPHRPLAPRAGHDLDGEYPFQQLGPREPALADRVVGAVVARVIDSNVKRWSAREERIDSAREERVDRLEHAATLSLRQAIDPRAPTLPPRELIDYLLRRRVELPPSTNDEETVGAD